MLRGIGLLSLLIAVAILGILGARAISDSSTSPDELATLELTDTSTTLAPGADLGGSDATGPSGLGQVDAAARASCIADRSAMETAVSTFTASIGTPPLDEQALVDAGMLSAPVDGFDLAVVDGSTTVVGVGTCLGM